MIILAIDTSLGPCSVALMRTGTVIAELATTEPGQQSRALVPMIESLLTQAGLHYNDCDAVACTIGPGGFTGIRTGLATARTIAMATEKPLIGLSTLEVIAFTSGIKGDVLAVIDAYRDEWYVQRFRMHEGLQPLSDPLLADEKGVKALGHAAKTVQTPVLARDVAALAFSKWSAGEREFPKTPLYIREPDAKLPANEGLKCEDSLL